MKEVYKFDTIDGEVVAKRRYDATNSEVFYDCYLNGTWVFEVIDFHDEAELEQRIKDEMF